MIKKAMQLMLFSFCFLILFGCSEVQYTYHEVHVLVIDGSLFYYVDPTEGKDTISVKYMDHKETVFTYLYVHNPNREFSYNEFFESIGNQSLYRDIRNNKLYIQASSDIDFWIHNFMINYDIWKEQSSS